MKVLGFIIAACLALALLKVAVTLLVAIYVVLLIVAMITKPAETFGFLAFFFGCYLLEQHTIPTMLAFVALCFVGVLAKRRSK